MNKVMTYSLCEPFIERLADDIERESIRPGKDLSRLAVVFGGRRPALFVNRELARRIQKTFSPPRFFTIDDFIRYIVEKQEAFRPARDLDSCYLLYTLARKAAPAVLEGRESFAQFLPWSREILQFIDQLDLEGVEEKRLKNIQANAAIGYDVPADINRLLEHIITLRRAYHEHMQREKIYARGRQYLRAAELIGQSDFSEFDRILFCNFFYFNGAEAKIVKTLLQREKAVVVFQGDERKWPILERTGRYLGCPLREGDTPRRPGFRLHLYKAFDTHSQAALVREILKKIPHPQKSVIVLPDADHLAPLLSEVSGVVKDFNVSMGYPLRRSSLYALCGLVFKAQLSRKDGRYYAKDYLKALRHPFIKNLHLFPDVPPAAVRILIHKIEEILTGRERTPISGSLFIGLDETAGLQELYLSASETMRRAGMRLHAPRLREVLRQIHEMLFQRWESIRNFQEFAGVLDGFLDVLTDKSFMSHYPLSVNIAEAMHALKEEFQEAGFRAEDFSQEEIFRIFDGKISREMISFHGSPLKGLQILGLFETRSLSFEDVIMLDVNEGVLPKLSVYEPLIPREVMVSLNLDRLELEEEIQRYQFMHLIASAKNVHLVYEEGKDKEKSRFIEELIWERQKHIKEEGLALAQEVVPEVQARFEVKVSGEGCVVPKTDAVIQHLRSMRYSASSLNMYLRNPLEFYYSYVLGLRPQEDLLDEPEGRQVGIFIHELLEEAFRPFLRKKPKIDQAFRQRFAKMFEERFEAVLAKSMKSDAFMLRTVITERLNRFLDNEERHADRRVEEILCLESRFEDVIPLSCGDIRFSYVIDRLDRLADGTHMIIDYKTGGVEQMPQAPERIAATVLSRESVREQVRSFQIPLYFYYLDRTFPGKSINAALYNLRTLKLDKFIKDRAAWPREQINTAFLRALDFIISEILNPQVPFTSEENLQFLRGSK